MKINVLENIESIREFVNSQFLHVTLATLIVLTDFYVCPLSFSGVGSPGVSGAARYSESPYVSLLVQDGRF